MVFLRPHSRVCQNSGSWRNNFLGRDAEKVLRVPVGKIKKKTQGPHSPSGGTVDFEQSLGGRDDFLLHHQIFLEPDSTTESSSMQVFIHTDT